VTTLVVVVEGQTEQAFVHALLRPHLAELGVFASATIVGKLVAARRGHSTRGGGAFRHWLADIRRILGETRRPELRVTTMFDLYGLPDDFPGLADAAGGAPAAARCVALEARLAEVVGDPRFVPYLQVHEFEALVLAALPSLRRLLDAREDLDGCDALAREIGDLDPEVINDGAETAPSKRLRRSIPSYSKALHGPLATEDLGVPALRRRCPRFGAWLARLEGLGAP
jgi:hypothetical protein